MIKKRCFLCGHKMAENGLCTNVNCIRSEPVTETEIKDKSVTESTEKQEQTLLGAGFDIIIRTCSKVY